MTNKYPTAPWLRRGGFTLLELLIVLVILGIIAGLAFPVLSANVEKSKAQEAYTMLGTIKEAMVKFYQTTGNSSYVGGDSFTALGITNPASTAANGGQAAKFTYTFGVPTSVSWTATATSSPAGKGTVVINQTGTITPTGSYV